MVDVNVNVNVNVNVPGQLQQWTFEKAAARPDRSDSAANSPDLYNTEAVRISPNAGESPDDRDRPESFFQDRYLSSEEDLSSMEDSYEDDVEDAVFEEAVNASAKAVAMPGTDKAKACDMAVVVSYVSAGRPKIVSAGRPKLVEMPAVPPMREQPERSASLVDLPTAFKATLAKQAPRMSISTSTPSRTLYNPAAGLPPRNSSFTPELSGLRISTSPLSTRNSTYSPASSVESFHRPRTARATSSHQPQRPHTSSMYMTTNAAPKTPSTDSPSTTSPFSPNTPSFLSSDPFAADSTSAASPIIKNSPHKRLRSLSRGLILAKNAVLPAHKKGESRGRGWGVIDDSSYAPRTPTTPRTPVSAGPKAPIVSSKKAVKLVTSGANEREPIIEIPPPSRALEMEENRKRQSRPKLVPRGADERAPPLELPPCPDSETESLSERMPARRVRKRRSMMDFEKLTRF